MFRYRFIVEYDGRPFVGWQRQTNGPSVQAAIEDAIEACNGAASSVFGAGRTDAGVHALAQVAHVDLSRDWPPERLRDALNAHLVESGVAILDVARVPANFDARFSAVRRRYLYRILNRRAPPTFDRERAWHVRRPLDEAAMHAAAQALVGHHDFTTFRNAACQAKSPVKTLERLDVVRVDQEVHVTAASRSFLHNQVRSMVGTLALVGHGRRSAVDVTAALEARDRRACGPVAPPYGLYLLGVDYEDAAQWNASTFASLSRQHPFPTLGSKTLLD